MARTALTIQTAQAFLAGITGGAVATLSDATNEMSVDLTAAPNLVLVSINTSAGALDYTIPRVAANATFNATGTTTVSTPAAVGGAPGVNIVRIDAVSAIKQTGNVMHIDIVTATGLYLFAAVLNGTPSGGF